MKKIIILAAVAIAALANTSCGGLLGVNLADAESVQKHLPKLIEKHIDPQSVVTEISLMGTGDFTNSMDVAVVYYFEPGSEEIKGMNITLSGGAKHMRETKVLGSDAKRTPDTGIKLADVDFSKIASNIAEAVEFLADEDLPFDGIELYRIRVTGDPAETMHKFSLESKAGSEMSTKRGRLEHVTNYYTFEFEADADGNVEYVGE